MEDSKKKSYLETDHSSLRAAGSRAGPDRRSAMKKNGSKYCGDDPEFMAWFAGHADLNPDFDPEKTKITSTDRLYVHKKDNSVGHITICYLFRENQRFHAPVKIPSKCWLDAKFRDWFDPVLNPDIDPTKLSYGDLKTRLKYRAKDTLEICSITPHGLQTKKDWDTAPKHISAATSVPGFIEFYEKNRELNQGIDLSSLSKFDDTLLKYHTIDGGIQSAPTCVICQCLDSPCEADPVGRCTDVPGFNEWFEAYRQFNTDIDPSTLTTDMTTVVLTYLYNGRLHKVTPRTLCHHKDLLSTLRRTIRGDPAFWSYCIEEDRITVDSFNRNESVQHFRMRCPIGHEYNQTPIRFYYNANKGRDPCPCCNERKVFVPGFNDAATVDPEIKLFYSEDNDKPVHMVGAYNAHSNFKFKCPYCGHEFSRRMKNIVGKHPKCPQCKDKGLDVPQNTDYMPEGIPFLVIQDDLKPVKMRKKK